MTTEELISELLERLKNPDTDQDAFEEMTERVKILQSLLQEK